MTRHTLICTVGTSLFESNLNRLSERSEGRPSNWRAMREAFLGKRWKTLARELVEVDPSERICGAEINSVEEVRRKALEGMESIFFLVSDTEHGRDTGMVLQEYFRLRSDLALRNVVYCVVERLQDARPKDFKVHGLRNLVRRAGECIQRAGGPEHVLIDATGGYKAQIAIAVLIGQALNIPVTYKHERFSEVIAFPPLPISFDYGILARNAELLTDFERGDALSSGEVGPLDEKLRVLLTEVSGNGELLYELSPIGQIYLTGFRIRNPRPVALVAAQSPKPPTFRDDHYPIGFKDFVCKVWGENRWIRTASSLPYDKQRSIKGKGFSVREKDGTFQLVGTYQDRNRFGARFLLQITDESENALIWAADFLNQGYR